MRHLGDAHGGRRGKGLTAYSPARPHDHRSIRGLSLAAGLLLLLVLRTSPTFAQSYGELDTGFKITLNIRRAEPAGLEASLVSTATYPCAGYMIRGSAWSSRDTIVLSIHGMGRPTPCVPLASEASGTIYLGELRHPTTYLRIVYRGESDLYRLVAAGSRVTSTPIRSRYTRVQGG